MYSKLNLQIILWLNMQTNSDKFNLFSMQTEHEKNYSQPTVIAQYISQQLFLTNFGINFMLYCMSGQNFRYIKFQFQLGEEKSITYNG